MKFDAFILSKGAAATPDKPADLQILARDAMCVAAVMTMMTAFFSFAHVRTRFSWLLPATTWATYTFNRAFLIAASATGEGSLGL